MNLLEAIPGMTPKEVANRLHQYGVSDPLLPEEIELILMELGYEKLDPRQMAGLSYKAPTYAVDCIGPGQYTLGYPRIARVYTRIEVIRVVVSDHLASSWEASEWKDRKFTRYPWEPLSLRPVAALPSVPPF